ncbi:hypothetical protein GOV03_04245 [Candidatus Woesearchaeota archaeon]|nr:hypothetical protein [Candidatus Woesearchaeota archaeon]
MASELVDGILAEYARTKDKKELLGHISELEKGEETSLDSRYSEVFELYWAIMDKKGIKQAAKNYFVQDFFFADAEKLLERAGLKLTKALYQKRADYWFEREYFPEALDMYLQAGNSKGIKKSASLLEDSPYVDDRENALDGFLTINDQKSAHRVAEKVFVIHETTKNGIATMAQLGLEVTPKLWKSRAEYQLRESFNFENALEAYQHLGDEENIESVKRKIKLYLKLST